MEEEAAHTAATTRNTVQQVVIPTPLYPTLGSIQYHELYTYFTIEFSQQHCEIDTIFLISQTEIKTERG